MDNSLKSNEVVNEIQNYLDYLTENISNLEAILTYLEQHSILSNTEIAIIKSESSNQTQIWELLSIIQNKDATHINTFTQILLETENGHCVEKISHPIVEISEKRILDVKWWPDEKRLPCPFYATQQNGVLFVQKFNSILSKDVANKYELRTPSLQLFGQEGAGKTTMVKWFANFYQGSYDYIIWIDCNKENLRKSFSNLATHLQLQLKEQFDLDELTRKCYRILKQWKCLWIFDNLEWVDNNETTLNNWNMLPKRYKNFHVLITSENQGKDPTGINSIEIQILSSSESIKFLQKCLDCIFTKDEFEDQFKTLSDLLGHLPLALRLSVAALNQKKISPLQYTKFFGGQPKAKDYEEILLRTLNFSLELIKTHEGDDGALAIRILTVCGHVTTEDVEIDFLSCLEQNGTLQIDKAVEILEKYSLVTKSVVEKEQKYTWMTEKIFIDALKIHPYLRKVIPLVIAIEPKTSSDILNFNDPENKFLHHKLTTFINATEDIQTEHSNIPKQLSENLILSDLLTHQRFQEAAELSRLIAEHAGNAKSEFNYALCLQKFGETQKAKSLLENVYNKVPDFNSGTHYFMYGINYRYSHPMGIIDPNQDLTKEMVAGHLFLIYCKLQERDTALQLAQSMTILIPWSNEFLNIISKCINYSSVCNYHLECRNGLRDNHYICLRLKEEGYGKVVQIFYCNIYEKTYFPETDLKEFLVHNTKITLRNISTESLKLRYSHAQFTDATRVSARNIILWNVYLTHRKNGEEKNNRIFSNKILNCSEIKNFAINGKLISAQIFETSMREHLENGENLLQAIDRSLSSVSIFNYTLKCSHNFGKTSLSLSEHSEEKIIEIFDCQLKDKLRLPNSLDVLKLNNCKISGKSSDVVDFSQIRKLQLQEMSVDLGEAENINDLDVNTGRITDWKNVRCNINKMTLYETSFIEKTEMKIKSVTIILSSVDISLLPSSVEKLVLWNTKAINYSPEIRMPLNLQELTLNGLSLQNTDQAELTDLDISHLIPSSLKKLRMDYMNNNLISINVIASIEILHLSHCSIIIDSLICIQPKELKLTTVKILDGNKKQNKNISIDEFVDFHQLHKLELQGMKIDFSESVTLSEVSLADMEMVNWKNAKWEVSKLNLVRVPFLENTEMKVKELTISEHGATVDFSRLPPSIEKLFLYHATIVNCSPFPFEKTSLSSLQEMKWENIKFVDVEENPLSNIDISPLIPSCLRRFEYTGVGNHDTPTVSSECLSFIEYLRLEKCTVILTPGFEICPKELTLKKVKIMKTYNAEVENDILVNALVDFRQIQILKLENMSIDMGGDVNIHEVSLKYTTVLNWQNSKWRINLLSLLQFPEPTQIKINQLELLYEDDRINKIR